MEYVITENLINLRLDTFISQIEKNISRTYAKELIENNNIFVNNKNEKAGYKTKINDIVSINLPEPKVLDVVAEDIPLDIIYEDEYLLVVNKPKGMVVHPANGHYEKTLVNAIMFHCKDSLSTINGVIRPGIVHRIDKDTSGLLVIAKDDETHNFLAEQFKVHSNKRIYIALVNGIIKEDEGTVDEPIGRSKVDRKKMAIDKMGRNATTHYKVLERFKNETLLELKLETGRTHQIRVHMASIHHPLVGDNVYGNKNDKKHGDGQLLCATTLGFVHPKTKEFMEFSINLPTYFQNEINKRRKMLNA